MTRSVSLRPPPDATPRQLTAFASVRAAIPLLAAALWLTILAYPRAQAPPPPSVAAGPVVVAPFNNLGAQVEDDWIGAGIAETVSADLIRSGVPLAGPGDRARMLASGGTAGRAGDPADLDDNAIDMARRLGAVWLVTGAYRHVGPDLQITARVVEVRSGAVVHATTVDGLRDELFAAQDLIATELTARLVRGVAPASPASRQPGAIAAAPERPAAPVGEVTGRLDLDRDDPGAAGEPSRRSEGRGGFAATPVVERRRTVVGRTDQPPEVDGRLDDAVWETATRLTEFVQIAPVEGAPGTEATDVWLTFDSENLYLAFHVHYTDPGMMRANRSDRDDIRGDDVMAVLFDPFLDQQRAYQFQVNGYGVQADSIVNADGRSGGSSGRMVRPQQSGGVSRAGGGSSGSGLSGSGQFGIRGDDSWDTLFDTAGRIVDDGWTAEMSIPFKSLRYPTGAASVDRQWGFQITRIIRGKSEAQAWSPISRGVAGQLTQFGLLEGLSDLSTSRNLEILPEITGVRLGSLKSMDGAGLAFDEGEPEGDAGFGVKYGITPNLTADFTVNPDFSQIESDQPQIETNQRFALFFPEQRPFFLEGQEIFQTPTITNLLHTRSIVDPLFGGKLTGKVGRTTIGVIAANDEAAGRLDDETDPRFGATAQTFVGRARYDLYSESYLGAIATSREFGIEHNRVGGVDGRFRLGRTHRVSFLAAGSSTRIDEEGGLSGPVLEADYTRQGRNLGYGASYSSVDPEFRTATGFLPRNDYRQATTNVSYRWWPESALITWGPTLSYLRLYDHAGVLEDEQLQGRVSMSFQNNISLNGTISRDLERYNEVDFRKHGYGFFGVVSARLLSVVGGFNWGDGVLFGDNPYLGRSMTGNVLISARPTSRLRAELTGIFSQFVNPANDSEVFDVKIFRTRATYQFSTRLLLRHILEYNTSAVTLGNNLLLTYRINAGTVAFLGYDDRYRQGERIDELLFPTEALKRTNRAVFAKVSYLFRY